MSRLIVVANRLPVAVRKRAGQLRASASPGGLASGLSGLPETTERVWVGWPGIAEEELTEVERGQLDEQLEGQKSHAVYLNHREIEDYYYGFCNRTIWPLFHYFTEFTRYEERHWHAYVQANEKFCERVAPLLEPGDRVWVHDYQLMLLPQMLRGRVGGLEIGFFLHIPWPSYELFRLLPRREIILRGLMGADLIGFHTYDYVRHFLSSVSRLLEAEHTFGELTYGNRVVRVDAFPMGIEYERYAGSRELRKVSRELTKFARHSGGGRVVLSVDRLDYTKGIVNRLDAFDEFLERYPDYRGKVTLILVAVPSRTGVDSYQDLRDELDRRVGRVNGKYGTLEWSPVRYLYRSLPFERLTALYNLADVAMVTPLRDGMNLVAKEYVACRQDGQGVLILSEMAGSASEMGEALSVNPQDRNGMAEAIRDALEMPAAEQRARLEAMQDRLKRYPVSRWGSDFLDALEVAACRQREVMVRKLPRDQRERLREEYAGASRRLLLLDYDGTLVGFVANPDRARPDGQLHELLEVLGRDSRNEVVVVSGRNREKLGDWLGERPVSLVAEHGAYIQPRGGDWGMVEPFSNQWKEAIRPIFERFMDRTPGASIEEKDFALVWHYRRAAPELAYIRTQELRDAVLDLTTNLDLGAFEGNKILEVKNIGINKGRAAEHWLAREHWDFVLAIGDDYTDEDMFAMLGEEAWTIKVGPGISKARFNVDSVRDARDLLEELAACSRA